MVYIPPIAPLTFNTKPKERKTTEELVLSANNKTTTSASRSKRCAKCGERKDTNEFPKHSSSSDGIAAYCRACKNGLAKERRLRDPIARITHYTVTRIKNEWPKDKVPKDIQTNLEHYLGYRMSQLKKALREDVRTRYDKTLIACFKDGYHLDHIQPHSSFASLEIGDVEFQKCWAIENLRLIPSLENLQKGAKQDFYETAIKDEDDEFDEEFFDEEGDHIVDLIS